MSLCIVGSLQMEVMEEIRINRGLRAVVIQFGKGTELKAQVLAVAHNRKRQDGNPLPQTFSCRQLAVILLRERQWLLCPDKRNSKQQCRQKTEQAARHHLIRLPRMLLVKVRKALEAALETAFSEADFPLFFLSLFLPVIASATALPALLDRLEAALEERAHAAG